jgi:ATP-dependent Zn protease
MTIGIRGNSLGVTHFRIETEHYSYTKKEFEALIATSFGGYVAEELVYGKDNISAGAAGDLQNANKIARDMVGEYALGDHPNFMTLEVFPEDISTVISGSEVILKRGYEDAKSIVSKNRDKLDLLAKTLLEKETMDYEEIIGVLKIKPQ